MASCNGTGNQANEVAPVDTTATVEVAADDDATAMVNQFCKDYQADSSWTSHFADKAKAQVENLLNTSDGNLLAQCSTCSIKSMTLKSLEPSDDTHAIATIEVNTVSEEDQSPQTITHRLSLVKESNKWLIEDITDTTGDSEIL